MNVATTEKAKVAIKSLEDAKALLVKKFIAKVNEAPEVAVMHAAKLKGDKALVAIFKGSDDSGEKPLSVKARNQIALAKLKGKAFDAVRSSYDLIESGEVCEILGISKQALSKKAKAGKVIAYTHNGRKYYPDFQFESNKEVKAIESLTMAIGIDLCSDQEVNLLVGFLAKTMDFSNPGEVENEVPRYKLLGNADALKIIIRDFKNRLEMGK